MSRSSTRPIPGADQRLEAQVLRNPDREGNCPYRGPSGTCDGQTVQAYTHGKGWSAEPCRCGPDEAGPKEAIPLWGFDYEDAFCQCADIRLGAWEAIRVPLFGLFNDERSRAQAADVLFGPVEEQITRAYRAGRNTRKGQE